jgi:hypothetical protein
MKQKLFLLSFLILFTSSFLNSADGGHHRALAGPSPATTLRLQSIQGFGPLTVKLSKEINGRPFKDLLLEAQSQGWPTVGITSVRAAGQGDTLYLTPWWNSLSATEKAKRHPKFVTAADFIHWFPQVMQSPPPPVAYPHQSFVLSPPSSDTSRASSRTIIDSPAASSVSADVLQQMEVMQKRMAELERQQTERDKKEKREKEKQKRKLAEAQTAQKTAEERLKKLQTATREKEEQARVAAENRAADLKEEQIRKLAEAQAAQEATEAAKREELQRQLQEAAQRDKEEQDRKLKKAEAEKRRLQDQAQARALKEQQDKQLAKQQAITNAMAHNAYKKALQLLGKEDPKDPIILVKKALCVKKLGKRLNREHSGALQECLRLEQGNAKDILFALITTSKASPYEKWRWSMDDRIKDDPVSIQVRADLTLDCKTLRQAVAVPCKPQLEQGQRCQHRAAHEMLEPVASDPAAANSLLCLMYPPPGDKGYYYCHHVSKDLPFARHCLTTLQEAQNPNYNAIIKALNPVITQAEKEKEEERKRKEQEKFKAAAKAVQEKVKQPSETEVKLAATKTVNFQQKREEEEAAAKAAQEESRVERETQQKAESLKRKQAAAAEKEKAKRKQRVEEEKLLGKMAPAVKELTAKEVKAAKKEVEHLFTEDLKQNAQKIAELTAQAKRFNIPTLYKRFQALLHVKLPDNMKMIMCKHTLASMKTAILENKLIPVQRRRVAFQIVAHNLCTDAEEEWYFLTQAEQDGVINHKLLLLKADFFLRDNFPSRKPKGMVKSIVKCDRSLPDHQTCRHSEALNLYTTIVESLSLKPKLTPVEIEMLEQAQLHFAEFVVHSTCPSLKASHIETAAEYATRLLDSQRQSFIKRAESCIANFVAKEVQREVHTLSVHNALAEAPASAPAKTTISQETTISHSVVEECLQRAEKAIAERRFPAAYKLLKLGKKESIPTLIQEFNNTPATSSFSSIPTALLELQCCRLQILYLSLDGEKQLTKKDQEIQQRYKTVATWLHDKGITKGTEAWGVCIIDDCEAKHKKDCQCGFTQVFKEWQNCPNPTIEMLNIQIKYMEGSQKGEAISVETQNKRSLLLQKLGTHPDTPDKKRNHLKLKSAQLMVPQNEIQRAAQLTRMQHLFAHKEIEVQARTWLIDHFLAEQQLDQAFDAIGASNTKRLPSNQKQLIKYYEQQLIAAIKKDTLAITAETIVPSLNRLIQYAGHNQVAAPILSASASRIKKDLNIMSACVQKQGPPPFDFVLTMRWFILFPQALEYFKQNNPAFYYWHQGIHALAHEKFKEAKELLLKASKAKGGCPQANLALGLIYKEIKEYETALTYFNEGQQADPVQSAIEAAQCHLSLITQPRITKPQVLENFQKAWDLLDPHGSAGKYHQGTMISRGMCPRESVTLCKEKSPHKDDTCSHSVARKFLIEHALEDSLAQQALAQYYRKGMGVEQNRETALAYAREAVKINDYEGNTIELVCCLQQGTPEEIEESYKLLKQLSKTKPNAAKLLVTLAVERLQLYHLQGVLGENGILSDESYTDDERAALRTLLQVKLPELHTLWTTSVDFTPQSVLRYPEVILDLVNIAFGDDHSTLPESQQTFIRDLQYLEGPDNEPTDLDKHEIIYGKKVMDTITAVRAKRITKEEGQWNMAQARLLNPGSSCAHLNSSLLSIVTVEALQPDEPMRAILEEMLPEYLLILSYQLKMDNFDGIKISTLRVINTLIQRLHETGRDTSMFERALHGILFSKLHLLTNPKILTFTEQKGALAPFVLELVKQNKDSLDMSLAMVLIPTLRRLCNEGCQTAETAEAATLIGTSKEICQRLQAQVETAPPAVYLVKEWKKRLTQLDDAITRLEQVQTTGHPSVPSRLTTLGNINGIETEHATFLTTLILQSAACEITKHRRTSTSQVSPPTSVREYLQPEQLTAMVNSYEQDHKKFAPTLTLLLLKLDELEHYYPNQKDLAKTLFGLIVSLIHTENSAGRPENILQALESTLTAKSRSERRFTPNIVMDIIEHCNPFFDAHQEELQGLLKTLASHARDAKEPGNATIHALTEQFPQWFSIIGSGTGLSMKIRGSQAILRLIDIPVESAPAPVTLVKPLTSRSHHMSGTQEERVALATELENLVPPGTTDKLAQLMKTEEIITFATNYKPDPRLNIGVPVAGLILKLDQLRLHQDDIRYGDATNILHRLVLSCLASELRKENGGAIVLNILGGALSSKQCPEPEVLAQFLKPCAQHLPQMVERKVFVQLLYFYALSFSTKSAIPALELLAESFPDIINIEIIKENHKTYTLKNSEKIDIPHFIEQYEKGIVSFRCATAQLFGSFYQDEASTVTMETFLPLLKVAWKKGIRISDGGDPLQETLGSAVISDMRSQKHILLALQAWEDVVANDTESASAIARIKELDAIKELYTIVKMAHPDTAGKNAIVVIPDKLDGVK